jgi:diadenosine tetraphosphate (Ap4A) HIT family hydrolase
MTFILDPRIEDSSVFICDWNLSHVRLSTNAAFPWLLLMPRRADMRELIDLSIPEQEELLREIRFASHVMKRLYDPTKLNVASIGNMTPQLHIHIVARYDTDEAWPGPIWNSGVKKEYEPEKLAAQIEMLQQELKDFS